MRNQKSIRQEKRAGRGCEKPNRQLANSRNLLVGNIVVKKTVRSQMALQWT